MLANLHIPIPYGDMKSLKFSPSKNKSSDLIKVIEHLSKITEKHKLENDVLRKNAPSNVKYMEMSAEVKRLKLRNAELEKRDADVRSNATQLQK